MKKMASWLIIILIIMFWIFRLVVCYMDSMAIETGFNPIDFKNFILSNLVN